MQTTSCLRGCICRVTFLRSRALKSVPNGKQGRMKTTTTSGKTSRKEGLQQLGLLRLPTLLLLRLLRLPKLQQKTLDGSLLEGILRNGPYQLRFAVVLFLAITIVDVRVARFVLASSPLRRERPDGQRAVGKSKSTNATCPDCPKCYYKTCSGKTYCHQ